MRLVIGDREESLCYQSEEEQDRLPPYVFCVSALRRGGVSFPEVPTARGQLAVALFVTL